LINYYNGALLSDYNTFLNFADRDGFSGLKGIRFVPLFFIGEKEQTTTVTIVPFEDLPRGTVNPPKQNTAISKNAFHALVNYVDLINETWRQVSRQRDVIRNLNSSASYYASLTSYAGKGGLSFSHSGFEVPLSHLQKAISESKSLSPEIAKSLNTGAQVIVNILREMDEIGAALETEITEKKYQQDKVKHVYELITRTHVLFNAWDEKKEILYEDIQRVYDSFPSADHSSWSVSGNALRELTALDHNALFKAKQYYRGTSNGQVETTAIDEKLRDVLAKEYDNMKGIQKFGRYNGLCPYTPYEDLPKNSRTLSESLSALKPAKENADTYQHPYHSLVYVYNEVVDDYNKFCELSPVPLLPYVKQPELFILVPPKDPQSEEKNPIGEHKQTPVQETSPAVVSRPEQKPVEKGNEVKVFRDTVYIEKRDTIYLHDPADDGRSMEGYATNNMVLLLDVSGSMNTPDKLPLLKQSVISILTMMRQEDQISIVVFSGKPKVLLSPTSFKDEEKIKKAISSLKPSGKTDGNAGLKLAYKVADENYIRGGNNRILLATDGEFPINDDVVSQIEKFSKEDIFLTVFNFGNKSASAKNLQRVSTLGKGNYEFISRENVELKLIREAKAKRKK
jgi:Ca-activated chloride channel homolog